MFCHGLSFAIAFRVTTVIIYSFLADKDFEIECQRSKEGDEWELVSAKLVDK